MNPTSLPAALFRKRQFVQIDSASTSLPATLARTRWRVSELYRRA